jgi:aryl-alcohol dehydrogenase-like predicted oxidoreductase
MKIAIGTVQFGVDYGVANQSGRVQYDEVQEILRIAAMQTIDTLDTAIAYGDSERMLGQAGVCDWKVVTKLSALPFDCVDIAGWVESQVENSLLRLGINRLHGVLLHRPDQLLGDTGEQLFSALQYIKAQGLTKKIGVSIYGYQELDRLTRAMDFDMVQAPLNILDRSLIESGWASRLKARGVELHVRSAFLQGLLLLRPDQRPLSNLPNWPQPIDSNLIDPSQWSKL